MNEKIGLFLCTIESTLHSEIFQISEQMRVSYGAWGSMSATYHST